jgi:demethylmenaquinone methyltransferase / 2-methoxy-6-polyprenyl-1,4-benzoquinol methylase
LVAAGVQQEREFGLGNDWSKVELVLAEVIPVYEKVNRYISLGTDIEIRREGIRHLLHSIFGENRSGVARLIDLGSGPGMMSRLASAEPESSRIEIVQVDALLPMMRFARNANHDCSQVLGTYEHLPLMDGSSSAVMAGFAIRDARDLALALKQIARILEPGGRFLIVDLSKPDSRTKRVLIGVYWRVFSPLLATIASPKLGRRFAALYTTFQKLPAKSEFRALARKCGFDFEFERYHMMGASAVILLRKSPKSSIG